MDILIVLILVLFALFLFLPGQGYFAKRKKVKLYKERINIEDTLKHLYDSESKKIKCTVKNLAGSLNIGVEEVRQITELLNNRGLITIGENLQLTAEGQKYALRIIRVHRLWEKFLADETSIPENEWHSNAELKEHELSGSQIAELAAQLGNPVYDPHGDPIPTEAGTLPEKKWKLLSSLKAGEVAQISHIEDEPVQIYTKLIAEGLYAGMHVKMIEPSSDRIKFEANGDEVTLSIDLADNISIAPLSRFEKVPETYKTLSELKPGEEAEVIGLSKACRGSQRRRLMDLGVVPGSVISNEFVSTWGDPAAYKIRGATIGLRKKQAQQIYIKSKKNYDEKVNA